MNMAATSLRVTGKRKAQIEMVGLVVVVVLLTLGVFFVIKFIVLKQPSTTRQEFLFTQMASNTANALLKTQTDCRGYDMTELIGDCAKNLPLGRKECSGSFSGILEEQICTTGYNLTFCITECELQRDTCIRTELRPLEGIQDIQDYVGKCQDPRLDNGVEIPETALHYPHYDFFTQTIDNTFNDCIASCQDPAIYDEQECRALVQQLNASIRSCAYAAHTSKFLIDSTLGSWKRKYRFSVYEGSERPEFGRYTGTVSLWLQNDDCASGNIEAKPYPLSYSGRQVIAQMEICG